MTRAALLLWAVVTLPVLPVEAAPNMEIWDTRARATVTETALVTRLAQQDVIFLGEQHDDPATHALELRLLQDIHGQAGKRLTLAMEMFERDVQPSLVSYLAGKTDEAAFLAHSRPWSTYKTDYRPLVEFARANGIPVVASNAPQPVVSRVGREGLAALAATPAGQVAALIQAPHDAYWERFRAVMSDMGGAHGGAAMDAQTVGRFYEAQVVRDETMADSVAQVLDTDPGRVVLHINGQFHSDYGDGLPKRVLWRRPLTRQIILSVLPTTDLKQPLLHDARLLADYVVFVPAKRK